MEGSTLEGRRGSAAGPAPRGGVAAVLAAPGAGGWLLALLLACCAYAAFASGATTVPEESRLQAGIAAALVLGGIGAAAGALGAARSPLAWAGAGLLALFGLWSALSVGWSLAPDVGWLASNRAIAYAIVVALALLCAPAVRGAPAAFAVGFTVIALAVALYALGGKIAPQLTLGPVDLDHASDFSRLRAPLGYWNALGLLLVMATPPCIWVAASPRARGVVRVLSLLALELLIVAASLTYSRGAVVAYGVALAAMVIGGPSRLRRLAAGGLTPLFAAAPVAFAFSRPDLADDGVAAAQRVDDGRLLGLILLGSLLALAGVAWIAGWIERRARWTPRRSRVVWRALALAAVLGALAGVGLLATSERGLTGTASEEWRVFKQPHEVTNDPERLVSSNSSNRWTWWREAVGAFSDKPLVGWGAGSFPILHSLYREHFTQVRSAHSAPLQFLAEGGLIGAGLGLGGIGLLIAAAVVGVRRARGGERDARLALLAAGCAWAVHCLYDWDWEIPAVTLPALIALAIAAAPYGPVSATASRRKASARIPGGALLAGATALVAAAVCASAALPSLAQDRRLDAELVSGNDQASLDRAASNAALAHKLDPFAVDPLFASADVALRRGDSVAAQQFLEQAVRVQPDNARVWSRLLQFELQGRVGGNTEKVVGGVVRTNPLKLTRSRGFFSQLVFILQVPASSSPTAYGTPPVEPRANPASKPG